MSVKTVLYKSVVLKKSIWTIFLVGLYILGSHINLPIVVDHFINSETDVVTLYIAQILGTYQNYSVFSLGLSPWMNAMIIIMVLQWLKWFKIHRLSSKETNLLRNVLVFILAFWQSKSLVDQFTLSRIIVNSEFTKLYLQLILIAGAFVLIFMANINGEKGLGGALIFIFINMTLMLFKLCMQFILTTPMTVETISTMILIFIIFVLFMMLNILIGRSEYRIKVNRLLVHSELQQSYIAIRLNPAGGMPFMYGMLILTLITRIILFLGNWLRIGLLMDIYNSLYLYSLSGAIVYIVLLIVLTYAFGFMQVDPVKMANGMQKSGDYIEGIRPGLPTKDYLHQKVFRLSTFAAIYITVFVGLPTIFAIFYPEHRMFLMIPGTLMLLCGVVIGLDETIKMLTLGKYYSLNIFDEIDME